MFGRKKRSEPALGPGFVDNRGFLLGLDQLYRDSMKQFERGELIDCAHQVAEVLGVAPADVPIEGYYHEDETLTEYFRLLRGLQNIDWAAKSNVSHLPAFQRLVETYSSPIFGRPQPGKLLPHGRDPLTQALEDVPMRDWSVDRLVEAARETALEWDDISLVGLAASIGDAVVLTALRESVILYAERPITGLPGMWAVDQDLMERASRFISEFNRICPFQLPEIPSPPVPLAFTWYWYNLYSDSDIIDRCACLAVPPEGRPGRYYQWAIRADADGEPIVEEFWSRRLQSTQRLRAGPVSRLVPSWSSRKRVRWTTGGLRRHAASRRR